MINRYPFHQDITNSIIKTKPMQCKLFGCEDQANPPFHACSTIHSGFLKAEKQEYQDYANLYQLTDDQKNNGIRFGNTNLKKQFIYEWPIEKIEHYAEMV